MGKSRNFHLGGGTNTKQRRRGIHVYMQTPAVSAKMGGRGVCDRAPLLNLPLKDYVNFIWLNIWLMLFQRLMSLKAALPYNDNL